MAEYIMKKGMFQMGKNHMQRYCRRRNLTFEAVPTQYTRSSNYRSRFLQSIHHQPENIGVHTVGKRRQKIK